MEKKKVNSKAEKKPPFLKRKRVKIFLSIIILLVVIRIAFPHIILHYANKSLASLDGYFGHINDIDLAIYRGAYTIKDIYIHKADTITKMETEFFDSRVIDLSVEWDALFDGRIVGELEFQDPLLVFTKDKVEPGQIAKDTNDFRKILDDFMPLKVNRFEIFNGTIKYTDKGSKPPVALEMNNTHVLAQNLSSVKATELLPATVAAEADLYGGKLLFNMKMDPLADDLTFDMNTELKNTELPQLNDFFKAYAKLDVSRGTFGLYTEVAAKEGKFKGYVKPLIKDLDVLGPEDKDDKLLQKFWEAFAGGVGVLFRNQKHDQVATKIPFEGTFRKTDANIWYAVIDILRNAFIEALRPSLDDEINIGSVEEVDVKKPAGGENAAKPEEKKKGFLKKIFKGKDRDSKKEENMEEPAKEEKK